MQRSNRLEARRRYKERLAGIVPMSQETLTDRVAQDRWANQVVALADALLREDQRAQHADHLLQEAFDLPAETASHLNRQGIRRLQDFVELSLGEIERLPGIDSGRQAQSLVAKIERMGFVLRKSERTADSEETTI